MAWLCIIFILSVDTLVQSELRFNVPINQCIQVPNPLSDCFYNLYCNGLITPSFRSRSYDCSGKYVIALRDGYNEQEFIPLHVYYESNEEMRTDIFEENYLRQITTLLDVSNNNFVFLPSLTSMYNLATLNLFNNSLFEATLSYSENLTNLTEIDFSFNEIDRIIVDTEHKYPFKSLKKLNISNNMLTTVQDTTFDKFNEIEILDLSHNNIDTLNVLTFEGLKNLLELYLSHNDITNINSSFLRFNKLRTLDISHNNINALNSNDFGKLIHLINLDLSFNSVLSIEKYIFNNLNLLKTLDVSNGKLKSIDNEAFVNISQLAEINFAKNSLKYLPKYLFKNKYIKNFSIAENSLQGPLEKGMFEGLAFVTNLDLSHQFLTSIENFAFFGAESATTLALNNNKIQSISKKSFEYLRRLTYLDLSNNLIASMVFDKGDLSLSFLSLNNNRLSHIKSEDITGLKTLTFLDVSNNNISHIEENSFKSMNDLRTLQISNNPISGILKENTFDGLNLLPGLDISSTLLTTISNSSFNSMTHLSNLNISHSKIKHIQYNAFINTGAIESLDLSVNQIVDFIVNTTDLINVNILLLNNNYIKVITHNFLKGLLLLNEINLSHNNIENIHDKTFKDQRDLRILDLSYNSNLIFNVSQIEQCQLLDSLQLSGLRTVITFKNISDNFLSKLDISNALIDNINVLELKRLKNLNQLVLSYNKIVRVEIEAFSNLSSLTTLDLSFNKITYVQSGAFKDNSRLYSLNMSHNALNNINYGIFRNLLYLNTLDLSYNLIGNIDSQRFHELTSLAVLIVDNNNIKSLELLGFGTSLSTLSIGNNPLPCEVLVNLKKYNSRISVTAIILDETGPENFKGIICNRNSGRSQFKSNASNTIGYDEILLDIKDILGNISVTKDSEKNYVSPTNNESLYLTNISRQIENSNNFISSLNSNTVKGNNYTNFLLDRIFRLLSSANTIRKPILSPVITENSTAVNLIPFINKVKQDLEDTIALEKQNILIEVEHKISSINTSKEPVESTKTNNEAVIGNKKSDSPSVTFIEVCVGLILVILIMFILYKFYNSGMFVPNSRSHSTRHLADAIENSNL